MLGVGAVVLVAACVAAVRLAVVGVVEVEHSRRVERSDPCWLSSSYSRRPAQALLTAMAMAMAEWVGRRRL